MKIVKQVTEFHQKFGHPVEDKPNLQYYSRLWLRYKLLKEEVEEFLEASGKQDIVGVADAICDIMYVAVGTAVECGFADRLQALLDEVNASNNSKLGIDGKPILRKDGKIMKGPNYFPPNLKKILEEGGES